MRATIVPTVALSLAMIFACFSIHYEALRLLTGITARSRTRSRFVLALAMAGLVAVHVGEIALFGAAYYASVHVFHLGTFVETRSMALMDYFYYAAETYSSLGYGDIYPLGDLRLLASVTPVIGILLLGWSSAFLFSLVQVDRAGT